MGEFGTIWRPRFEGGSMTETGGRLVLVENKSFHQFAVYVFFLYQCFCITNSADSFLIIEKIKTVIMTMMMMILVLCRLKRTAVTAKFYLQRKKRVKANCENPIENPLTLNFPCFVISFSSQVALTFPL